MWPIIDQISTDQLVPFGDLLNCEYYVGRLADNVARVKAGMKFKDRMVQRRKDWLGGE